MGAEKFLIGTASADVRASEEQGFSLFLSAPRFGGFDFFRRLEIRAYIYI
jgi:hypothetical protein